MLNLSISEQRQICGGRAVIRITEIAYDKPLCELETRFEYYDTWEEACAAYKDLCSSNYGGYAIDEPVWVD